MTEKQRFFESISDAQVSAECGTFRESAEIIFKACKNVIGFDSGLIIRLSEDYTESEIVFVDCGVQASVLNPELNVPLRDLHKKCLSLTQTIFNNNYEDSEWKKLLPFGDSSPENILISPFHNREELIGVLVFAGKPSGFNNEDAQIAGIFAKTSSVAFCSINDRKNLIETEKKYKTLFDNLPVALYVTDTMEQIVEMNRKMLDLLDIEKVDEFSGQDILKFYANPQDRANWQEQLEKTGSVSYFETRLRSKNGDLLWVSESANLIEGPSGQQYCEVAIEDITTRKNSEEAFSKVYLELDKAHRELNDRAGWMEKLNTFLIEIAGFSDEDEFYRHFLVKISENLASDAAAISTLEPGNELFNFLMLRNSVFEEHSIEITKTDLGVLNSNTKEPLLLDLEKIIKIGHATELTEFLKNMIKDDENEIILLPFYKEENLYGNIIISVTKDFFDDNYSYFIKNAAEFFSLIISNIKLIDKVQESYKQLEAAQEAIKKQERIKAMGQIASGITHDINNTLAPIVLYTEALAETEAGLSERAHKYLKTIQNAVSDIENVTQRLRTFYRQNDELNLELINVSELFDEVIELTRPKWKNIPNRRGVSVILKKDVKDKDIIINGVRSDIRESLMNCVFNSVDAMPCRFPL